MRVLVTGAAGFAGRHLVRELRRRGHAVYGLVRRRAQRAPVRALGAVPVLGDVTRRRDLERALRLARPDAVAHLAAESFVPAAASDPEGTLRTTVAGTRLLAAVLSRQVPKARLLYVSTGMVYGPVRRGLPAEGAPARPANVYAEAKLAAERVLREVPGLDLVVARPFNHAGPGQDPRFVVSSFARQAVRIERGIQAPVVKVGDLSARRSFVDVRDVVRAYADLLVRGRPGRVYNVAGRGTVPMSAVLDLVRKAARKPFRVEVEAGRRRGADRFAGSAARIRRELGWVPRIPLARTVADVLADWRGKERGTA